MPFLLAEILNFQGSTHRIGVGSFSKELCLYLGVGQTKARELIRGNNGFGVQIGNRWYANKKELDRWLEKNTA